MPCSSAPRVQHHLDHALLPPLKHVIGPHPLPQGHAVGDDVGNGVPLGLHDGQKLLHVRAGGAAAEPVGVGGGGVAGLRAVWVMVLRCLDNDSMGGKD